MNEHSAPATAYGRYRLLESIGRGAMTEVFKAKSFGVEGFEKIFVVKRLYRDLSGDKAFLDAFVAQAKLAMRLSHANVVQVFDLGRVDSEEGPSYFAATEYVPGVSLAWLLDRLGARGERLSVPVSLYIAAEVAKALDHAHRRRDEHQALLGVVHADLSPQNVLLSWEGEVKVSDFCTARALYDACPRTPIERLHRKYPYSSPEQIEGRATDGRSDVFALGSLLYECLAGTNPFFSDSHVETHERVSKTRFMPLCDAEPRVDAKLSRVVGRALERAPSLRFATAAELHEELMAHAYAAAEYSDAQGLSDLLQVLREPWTRDAEATASELAVRSFAESGADDSLPPPPRAPSIPPLPLQLVSKPEISVLVFTVTEPARSDALRARARLILPRYGGRVVSETESELLSAFGLDRADARETENAVRCGLVLRRCLGDPKHSLGGVAIGVIESTADETPGEQFWEDQRVVEARRLSQLGAAQLIVTGAAAAELRGRFTLERVPHVSAVAFTVGEPRPPQDVLGAFVGRKRELSRAGELLARASTRKLTVVGLVGDQGVGKTRLLMEIEARLAQRAFNVGFYAARCPPRGLETPFSALGNMLALLCGVREGDPPEQIALVEPRLRALGLTLDEVRSIVTELGGGARGESTERASLQSAVARMFQSLAEDRLQIFAWDDAQAMDFETAALLAAITPELASSRALLLFAARRREADNYQSVPGYLQLDIGNLEPNEALKLVAKRLGTRSLPAELVTFLRERAMGHPMFIEELLHEAFESGAIVKRDGQIQVVRLDGSLAVPRSLHTLLADRVGRLPDAERNLVVSAAILGAPVDSSLLASMLDLPLGAVSALAERLEQREMLLREGPVSLRFSSALLPEVILSGLGPEVLAELHRVAASAYQRVFGERVDEHAQRVALHLAEAGERETAALWFAKSGLAARAAGLYDRAASDLVRAFELVDFDPPSEQTLVEWSSALAQVVRLAGAVPRLAEFVRRLHLRLTRPARTQSQERLATLVDLASLMAVLHRYKDARRVLERVRADKLTSSSTLRAALTAEAEIATQLGEFSAAVQALEQARTLGSGEPSEQHRLLLARAQALGGAGEIERALAALSEVAESANPNDRALGYECAKVRSLILAFSGDLAGSASAAALATELARAAGLGYELAWSLFNEADALLRSGELPKAYALFQSSRALASEVGSPRLVNSNRLMLAYLDAINGVESAQRTLGQALAYAEAQHYTIDVLTGRYLLGLLLSHRGDRTGAVRELGLAQRLALATENRRFAEDCARELRALQAS